MILEPLGDRAWLARFATDAEAAAWAASVRRASLSGVVDAVSAFRTASVHADPDRVDLDVLAEALRAVEVSVETRIAGRLVEVPVLYDGDDLDDVARSVGLDPLGVAEAHSGRDYEVLAVGFLPGFPYAGPLDPALAGLARRATPRTRVPAGSVAIVGGQTGVYPAESPGGWHLIGRTPHRIVDLALGHFPIRSGDRLRFVPIDAGEFRARMGELL